MIHTTTSRGGLLLRAVAFAAGFALVAAAVVSWRVPAGDGRPGADVVIAVAPTGELALSRTGPVLHGSNLRGGDEASGTLELTNQTGSTLAVSTRALPSAADLDGLLQVSIAAGNELVFQGPLGALRQWTRPFLLDSGEARTLEVRAWLPETDNGSEARVVNADLEFESRRRW
jgi:hypothetical protein